MLWIYHFGPWNQFVYYCPHFADDRIEAQRDYDLPKASDITRLVGHSDVRRENRSSLTSKEELWWPGWAPVEHWGWSQMEGWCFRQKRMQKCMPWSELGVYSQTQRMWVSRCVLGVVDGVLEIPAAGSQCWSWLHPQHPGSTLGILSPSCNCCMTHTTSFDVVINPWNGYVLSSLRLDYKYG